VHAEPTEHAMPSRSSDIATDAPSVSRAMTESSPGGASSGGPVISTPGTARSGAGDPLTLALQPGDRLGTLGARELVGDGQADRTGDVLGAGPAMALLRAALLLREDVRPVADVQDADALRPLELVGAHRDEIRIERPEVEVDVRRGLDRIDMQQDALLVSHVGRDLGDRLDRADLVVGEHDRDQDRLVREHRIELIGVHPAIAVDTELHDLEPELLQVAERVPDGVMLDRRGHDPVAARLALPTPRPSERGCWPRCRPR
jgi:hypothetical protein